jgi:hypothetical protein
LNYELETYMEALQDIPKIEAPLLTLQGEASLQKTDIFRKIMWFGYREENTWYPLNIDRVNEILELNRLGKKPATLDQDEVDEPVREGPLNNDLDQLDKKFKSKGRNKKKNRNKRSGGPQPGNNKNQNRPPRPSGGPNPNKPNPNNPKR